MDLSDHIKLLGRKYVPRILEVTDEPKSADRISDEADVPIGTTYRRINELTDAGWLIAEDNILTEDGRTKEIYKRNIDEIRIVFEDDEAVAKIKERSIPNNKIEEIWRRS